MVLCLPAVSPGERPEIQEDFEPCCSVCGKPVDGNQPQNLGRVSPIRKEKFRKNKKSFFCLFVFFNN